MSFVAVTMTLSGVTFLGDEYVYCGCNETSSWTMTGSFRFLTVRSGIMTVSVKTSVIRTCSGRSFLTPERRLGIKMAHIAPPDDSLRRCLRLTRMFLWLVTYILKRLKPSPSSLTFTDFSNPLFVM